jgi:hypothetical protein
MNKLRIFAGGFPIKNDDIDLIQDSMFVGVKGIVSAFAKQHNGYLVLSGIDVTILNQSSQIDTYNVTEGYLVYDYELFFCPAQVVDVPHGYDLEAAIDYSYPVVGTRQFINNITYDTHEVRRVIIRQAAQTGYNLPLPRIEDSIDYLLKKAMRSQIINTPLLAGWGNNEPIEVHLSGATKQLYFNLNTSQSLINAPAGTHEVVFTLPIEFSPQKRVLQNIAVPHNATFIIINIVIETNGDVVIYKLTNDMVGDVFCTAIYI